MKDLFFVIIKNISVKKPGWFDMARLFDMNHRYLNQTRYILKGHV